MNGKKIINIVGLRRPDIVYFLARMFATFGKPVLVSDNSEQHSVFKTVMPRTGSHMSEINEAYFRNITFIHDAMYSDELVDHFSAVICFTGMHVEPDWWDASGYHFVVTNYDCFDVADIRDMLRPVDIRSLNLICINKASSKISEKMVVEMLGLPKNILEGVIELPYDDSTERLIIALEYNGIAALSDTSRALRTCLLAMMKSIYSEGGRPELKNIFK